MNSLERNKETALSGTSALKQSKYKEYPEYKNTHLGWLTQIPEHWEVKRLKYLGNAIIGLTYSPDDVVDSAEEGTLVLRSSNVQNKQLAYDDNVYVNKVIPKHLKTLLGDILICARNGSRALIGKNAQIDENAVNMSFGAFMSIFRSPYNNYLSKVFNSALFEYQSGSFLTATINQLTTANLNSFEIPLPPSDERKKIANFLDHETAKIDTLIDKQQQLIKLLKEKRQAVISHAVTRGLNPDAPMKDSGVEWLGEVPAHWGVSAIKHRLISQDSRRIPLSSEERGKRTGDFRYYGASGVIDFIDDYIFDESTVLVGEDGANLVTRNTPLAFSAHGKYWVNNHAHILKTEDGLADYWAETIEHIDINPIVSGSAQPKLTAEALNNLKISYPKELKERVQIEQYIKVKKEKYGSLIGKANEQVALLSERRTALISAAVTGKIDVRHHASHPVGNGYQLREVMNG